MRLFLPIFCMILVMAVNILYDVASGNFALNFFTISIRNGVLYGRLIDILNRGSEIAILAIGMTLVVSASAISHFDAIASRRLAKNSHIHAVRCHLRLLFHGANAGIGIHSIFPARHIAFFARRNRTAHHTVADSHNDCRAACRKACGTFPPWNAWSYRHVPVFNRIDFVILFAGKRR